MHYRKGERRVGPKVTKIRPRLMIFGCMGAVTIAYSGWLDRWQTPAAIKLACRRNENFQISNEWSKEVENGGFGGKPAYTRRTLGRTERWRMAIARSPPTVQLPVLGHGDHIHSLQRFLLLTWLDSRRQLPIPEGLCCQCLSVTVSQSNGTYTQRAT
jgi:hypothetical protein